MMSIRKASRRGMAAVQIVLCLTVLVGIAALTVDGGMLVAERRHAQATADAAALAGASELFRKYASDAGADSSGTATASAKTIATANYSSDPTNLTVSVNIPPKTATTSYYNGRSGYVEVNVTYAQQRGFSAIWGSSRIPVSAHAVARGQWVNSNYAILTLDPTANADFNVAGGGSVKVNGGSILIDSNSASALKNSGGGSVTATSINVVGGTSGGGSFSPSPATGAAAVQDPLSSLPAPSPPAPGTIVKSGKNYTLTPGSYDGNGGPSMPKFTNSDTVTFKQASSNSAGGIYYLYAGLSSTGGNLSMDSSTTGGLMLYNAGTGSSAGISITGNSSGTVNLSGLTGVSSTSYYKGLLLFQARGSTQDLSVAGNGSFTMNGTIYMPDASLKVTGNGSAPGSVIGSQYIAKGLTVSGSGSVVVDYTNSVVAPSRFITLVE